MVEEAGRAERYAPLVAGIAIALPTLLAHYPPMSDLPLHEGVVGLMRHWGDDAYFPPELYTLNLGHANQLFHVVAWALSYLVGTTWAVKLVAASAQLFVFVLGARFADHLGRTRWSALLLAPLALGFTYYWGLVANLVGFAALLGVLPTIDRSAAAPTPRKAAVVCALLVLVFFAHEAVFIASIGLVGILAVAYPFDRRSTPLRLAPVGFAVLFMGAQWVYQQRFFTRGQLTPPAAFHSLWEKITGLPSDLFGSQETPVLVALSVLAVGALFLLAGARRDEENVRPPGLRGVLLTYRFELTALAFLFFYFVMPMSWRGATLVYQRFLGPAWLLLVVAVAPRKAPRIAKVLAGVLPFAILAVSWPEFVDADRTARDLDAVIEAVPLKSAVALLAIDRIENRTRLYSASVGPARTVATRGGRASLSLVISPLSPVQIRAEYRWDEYDMRSLAGGSRALKPTSDLLHFGWVIAQSREQELRDALVTVLEPDAELVMARGEWLLFRSRKPQAPLASPDLPAPLQAETVVERVSFLLQSRYSVPPAPR